MTVEHHDCCRPADITNHDNPQRSITRSGLLAAAGSVLSAVIASACCWLPLLLVALGVSVAGVSAAFEKVRPLFLTVSIILLAAGFYFVYVRREAQANKRWRGRPARENKRLNRTILWVAAAVVLAFAFFPKYAGFVLGKTASRDVQGNASGSRVVTLAIEGMTCEACAITIQKTLAAVPGVGNASVVFADREAHIILDRSSPASNKALIQAIAKAGYVAKLPAQTGPAP